MTTQRPRTEYERFESSSTATRRQLRQEELILQLTEHISTAMNNDGISRAELARRLAKSPAFISQILAGNRNLTLRTIADVCDALGRSCQVELRPQAKELAQHSSASLLTWNTWLRTFDSPATVTWESSKDKGQELELECEVA